MLNAMDASRLPPPSPDSSHDRTLPDPKAADAVVRILDEYLAAQKAGRAPSREQLMAQYPELAPQLEACLAGLEFIQQATDVESPAQVLGDFRIVREVGRGGMGAVFEAEQISLGRRVALKILRFGGVSDAQAIERFRREAETVAKLHHTNIVPIFAVGSERGVNYYAMQFIEGQSLAQLLADRPQSITPRQVSEWGLQAAEALAHAHQRGVVHRDVKPSNLLLDPEGRLWLTDFGLARRDDDVTLSMTGVLLGTPRYMSPEQANASTRRVDHRSDLFSLGATLYELLAQRPAFSGSSPHEVIDQILHRDPTPIRQVRPDVPRDLETIVLKCLAKDPTARYASAAELAQDLRAFLDGRPIRARRQPMIERAVRWLKQKERNVRHASLAAIITLAATITVLVLGRLYQTRQLASIRLDAAHPPLVAELVNEQDQRVRTETLPMQNAADLRSGNYKLRVTGDDTLSQTFDLYLERGQRNVLQRVDLRHQWMLAPTPIERAYDFASQDDQHGIIEWTDAGMTMHRTQGITRRWSLAFSRESSQLKEVPGFRWPWTASFHDGSGIGDATRQPWVLQESIDVNDDGYSDIILSARHQAWTMAVSGDGREILWFTSHDERLTTQKTRDPNASHLERLPGAVIYEPRAIPDVDGDQKNDLLLTLVAVSDETTVQQHLLDSRRWVEVISSRSGKSLWRFELADELFALAADEEVPYAWKWFPLALGGRSSSGGGAMQFGRHPIRQPTKWERTGPHVYLPDCPSVLQQAGSATIGLVAGKHLVVLDLRTGEPTEAPIALKSRPQRSIQWADVDGDRAEDLIYLANAAMPDSATQPTMESAPEVHVWSLARRKQLWSHRLDANFSSTGPAPAVSSTWPLVRDLNGDGRAEVIVPWERSQLADMFRGLGGIIAQETPWCSLAVLHGDSGQIQWKQRLVSMELQADRFLDGPDLNGDGVRELFVASLAGPDETLYVDALSGATGDTLWTFHQPTGADNTRIGELKWWTTSNQTPQLLVQLSNHQSAGKLRWIVVSAKDGKWAHQIDHAMDLTPLDLDLDGLEDLVAFQPKSESAPDQGGTLHCIRGFSKTIWQRLGNPGPAVVDLNGDGAKDFVTSYGDGTLITTDGVTGRELWRSRPLPAVDILMVHNITDDTYASLDTPPSSANDLDGDGHTDLLVSDRSSGGRGEIAPLHAISGRNGKRIWSITDVQAKQIGGTLNVTVRDLDGDDQPEVVWLAALDHGYPKRTWFGSHAVQLWMFVADARSGRLRWAQSLSPAYGITGGSVTPYSFQVPPIPLAIADLNEDGVLDLLSPAIRSSDELEVRAISGRDGATLWTRVRPNDGLSQQALANWTSPTVVDFEQDGQVEVIVVEPQAGFDPNSPSTGRFEVAIAALRGRDGEPLYRLPTGILYTHFRTHTSQQSDRLRPLGLRVGEKKQLAAVFMPGGNGKLVTINERGLFRERLLSDAVLSPGIRVCDADQDGTDELVLVAEQSLELLSAEELDKPRWKQPLQKTFASPLIRVSDARGLILVAADSTDNRVLGFDARTGQRVWNCPGPKLFDGSSYSTLEQLEILGCDEHDAPLIYAATSDFAICRAAARVKGIDTEPHHAQAASPSIATPSSVTLSVARDRTDPRWQRDLPWQRDFSVAPAYEFFAWSAIFSITLVLLPIGYALWHLRQRSQSLKGWLLLPVVAGIALLFSYVDAPLDDDFSTVPRRIFTGLAAAPPLLALGLVLLWGFHRQWKRILYWILGTATIGVLMGVISVTMYLQRAPLLPEETFDWSGWYMIFVPATYVVSCLALAISAFAWSVKKLIARWRPKNPSRNVAGSAATLSPPPPTLLHEPHPSREQRR